MMYKSKSKIVIILAQLSLEMSLLKRKKKCKVHENLDSVIINFHRWQIFVDKKLKNTFVKFELSK